MGRHKESWSPGVEYEILKAKITMTETGLPVERRYAPEFCVPVHGGGVWFWIAATPKAAAHIRANGHKAVGSLVTTWIPPQTLAHQIGAMPEPEGQYLPKYDDDDNMIGLIPERVTEEAA